MLPEYFAVIGAAVASIGWLVYLYETVKGSSRPNKITWLLWGILPMVTFAAQRIQGVEGVSWATFAAGFVPLLVFTASFYNKAAYWQTTQFDYVCMGIAGVGMVLWLLTKTPNLAILFMIFADAAAGVPTLIKAAKHPQTESASAFIVATCGFAVSAMAIPVWSFEYAAFLAYLLLLNGTISLLLLRSAMMVQSGSTKDNYESFVE